MMHSAVAVQPPKSSRRPMANPVPLGRDRVRLSGDLSKPRIPNELRKKTFLEEIIHTVSRLHAWPLRLVPVLKLFFHSREELR